MHRVLLLLFHPLLRLLVSLVCILVRAWLLLLRRAVGAACISAGRRRWIPSVGRAGGRLILVGEAGGSVMKQRLDGLVDTLSFFKVFMPCELLKGLGMPL